jgi:O-antigen/teichoic acid export membrane protein
MAPATPVGLLRLFDRFRVMSAQQAIGSAVRVIGSLPAFWLHAPIWVFLAIWAAGFAASFVYMVAASWTEMRRRDMLTGFDWSGPLTAGMPGAWRFAWATNFSSSLEVAFTHVATLMVGAGLGVADAALWRVARQVADGLAKPARLLIPALYPELARLHATEGLDAMKRLAGKIGLIGGGVATLLLAVVLVAGGPLLGLVMGPGFTHAAGTMSWQVAAAVIGVWALPLEPMLVSLGKPGAALRVRIVVAIVFLAGLRWAIAAFGLTGAGAALVAATIAVALGMLFELRLASAKVVN